MRGATALDHFDNSPLYQDLPRLITETDPNNLVTNIENVLAKYFKVDGLAISLNQSESIARFSQNKVIHASLLDELDKVFLDGTECHNFKQTKVIPFTAADGKISAIVGEENHSIKIQEANGLAFHVAGNDFEGGMYLMTDNETVNHFTSNGDKVENFISLINSLLTNSYAHFQNSEKMRFFSLYETVSSALGYVGDLQELLTTIISIVMAELPSEEGSVLLLDDSTNELEFFSAIGETGFGLTQLRFPADKGIAGHALTHREAIIVNDTETCPFFFKNIDEDSGFKTKSILAVPLISGEECIGVIEAINKVGSDCFDEQDKRILMAIADEVALAIKNARLFDFVVDSYCNIRQGNMTCKGCVRPLKSWTPCARQLDKV